MSDPLDRIYVAELIEADIKLNIADCVHDSTDRSVRLPRGKGHIRVVQRAEQPTTAPPTSSHLNGLPSSWREGPDSLRRGEPLRRAHAGHAQCQHGRVIFYSWAETVQ